MAVCVNPTEVVIKEVLMAYGMVPPIKLVEEPLCPIM
uniref:Uncharacterized protein n=1 Tax=viral metagenome TaxID=1070528 RepID=A0A6C0B7Q6_9ZZZZ